MSVCASVCGNRSSFCGNIKVTIEWNAVSSASMRSDVACSWNRHSTCHPASLLLQVKTSFPVMVLGSAARGAATATVRLWCTDQGGRLVGEVHLLRVTLRVGDPAVDEQ